MGPAGGVKMGAPGMGVGATGGATGPAGGVKTGAPGTGVGTAGRGVGTTGGGTAADETC